MSNRADAIQLLQSQRELSAIENSYRKSTEAMSQIPNEVVEDQKLKAKVRKFVIQKEEDEPKEEKEEA